MKASYETEQLLGSDSYHESLRGKFSSTRYKIAFLGFLGCALMYSMRVNISLTLVAMVTEQETQDDTFNENCPVDNETDSSSQEQSGTFDWTTTQQAFLLAAFFYGYLVFQIPAGYLATRYGGCKLFGWGLLGRSILLILNAPVAYLGVQWLICLRVLEGIVESATLPPFHRIISRWAPKFERSIFTGLALSGFSFGIILSQPIVGFLCTLDFLGGWPLSFLANGFLGIVWFFVWIYVATDTPDQHPRISESERNFINKNTQLDHGRKLDIPWKSILTSGPFFGLTIAHISMNIISYGIMTSLSLYLANVLNFEIDQNGSLSALPWLGCFLGIIISSQLTDYLRTRKYVSTTFIRKFNQLVGTIVPGTFLVLAGYSGCRSGLAVSFITIGMVFFGFQYSACSCNHLDIAPYFAGTLLGITNTFATLPGKILLTGR